MREELNLAEVLLKKIRLLGVESVFLVPGAQISPFVQALYSKNSSLYPKPIIAQHELGAGFMAIGYAKSTGKLGVVLSIGGPGAAYMVGAAVTAKSEKITVLFITGNLPLAYSNKGDFQDGGSLGTNDQGIFKAALDNSFSFKSKEQLNDLLIEISRCEHKQSSLHIQIPIDIQQSKVLTSPENQDSSLNSLKVDCGIDEMSNQLSDEYSNSLAQLKDLETNFNLKERKSNNELIFYHQIISVLHQITEGDDIYCLDAGQIRKSFNFFKPLFKHNQIIQSAKIAPMGLGICSAIGASFTTPKKRVFSLFGDGSIRMHGMELATAVRYQLPITFILCDNQSYSSSETIPLEAQKLPYTNWEYFAKSIGMDCVCIKSKNDFLKALIKNRENAKPVLYWLKVPQLFSEELEGLASINQEGWLKGLINIKV